MVFGDIGTSPLYAMRQSIQAAGGQTPDAIAALGCASLIFWALIFVVTIKYVTLIMRADNDGEGGSLALAALAHRSPGISRRLKSTIGIAALVGLALFYGDGMLTPAISVLSAVEGLGVGSDSFQPFVRAPRARHSGRTVLAAVARHRAYRTPVRPHHGGVARGDRGPRRDLDLSHARRSLGAESILRRCTVSFASRGPLLSTLGLVVLSVTGCEALYADMGHFGRNPIRYAWFIVVLPALVLSYFGQAAAVLRNPHAIGGVNDPTSYLFFGLVPHWAHYAMVILATIATVIASQAVISGVFSITQQAVQLGSFRAWKSATLRRPNTARSMCRA